MYYGDGWLCSSGVQGEDDAGTVSATIVFVHCSQHRHTCPPAPAPPAPTIILGTCRKRVGNEVVQARECRACP